MSIIICLDPLGFDRLFSYDSDPYAIKVVYDHTHIASYRRWCVGNVEKQYGYWLLTVRNAELAGGFPSNPILSGPRRTILYTTLIHNNRGQ